MQNGNNLTKNETKEAEPGRILIVDDNEVILDLIELYLQDLGFKTFIATNVQDGLQIFHKESPDVILSDLKMPVCGGLEFLKIIKEMSPQTPFVIISGSDDITDAIEALRLGAYDYIIKPFTQIQLEHVANRALQNVKLIKENKHNRLELEKKNIQLAASLNQLKEDMKAGRSVQQQLLPPPISYGEYSFSHRMIASLYLSGDFIDYFKINDHLIGFYLADVSGHGASSAFVTILLKALVEQLQANHQNGIDDSIVVPGKLLKHVNDEILNAKLGKYLTMIYCVLDYKKNTLSYSVGGHYPNPILCDGKNTIFLPGRGYAVGMVKRATFETFHYDLPPEFSFVIFSDGIFETLKRFNLQESENFILSKIGDPKLTIKELLKALDLEKEQLLPDDISLLMLNKTQLKDVLN